jgi:putative flippase GtrA
VMILKFLKFIIVGFTGMVVDFSLTILLKEKLKIHRYIANSTGFILAASSNYLFNRLWTFESNNPKILVEYSTFFIISLIGLGINNLVIFLLEKKLKFYFAKFVAIMVTSVWNFLANYYLNFTH